MKFLHTKQDFKDILKLPKVFFLMFSISVIGTIFLNISSANYIFLVIAWHIFFVYNICQIIIFSFYIKSSIELLANIVFFFSSSTGLLIYYLN